MTQIDKLGLQRSRITRDGLPKGTRAPAFCLVDIRQGQQFSLDSLRERYLLLVFSDPTCLPCDDLAPRLEALHHRTPDISVVMISRGSLEANRSKADQHGLTFPILIQRRLELSTLYGCFMTPIAFLIDPVGIIASKVAVGPAAILGLLKAAAIQCLLKND